MSRFRPRLTYANVMVTLLAFVVLAGGVAVAATKFVGSDGQIHGCVTNKGKLVLVKPSAKCKKGSPIAWNQKGRKGDRGSQGLRGAQGPGGLILTYDANASSTPMETPIGTAAGDTWSAECFLDSVASGSAELKVFLRTSDGSLKWDAGTELTADSSTTPKAAVVSFPSGTLSSPGAHIDDIFALAGGHETTEHQDIVQLGPSGADITYTSDAKTTTSPTTHTCHLSIQTIPEPVTAKTGFSAARPTGRLSGPLFGRK